MAKALIFWPGLIILKFIMGPGFITKTNELFCFKESRGLPWWLSGKESTCQSRRCRFDPWSEKIAHAAEQLSPSTTTTKACL